MRFIKYYLVIGNVIPIMFTNKVVLLSAVILATTVTYSVCSLSPRVNEGVGIVLDTTIYFYEMFSQCLNSAMPSKNTQTLSKMLEILRERNYYCQHCIHNIRFALDDLKNFVNHPSKTTVGYAPRFTSNRKFFANLLSTPEFKKMVEADEKILLQNIVKKMRYCDSVVMDEKLIKDMMDREVDQSKL